MKMFSIKISLKFVLKGPINNIPALVQIMAWRRPGYKRLSELMLENLLTHVCVTRPQWVKHWNTLSCLDQYMCSRMRLWNSQDPEMVYLNKHVQRTETMKQSGPWSDLSEKINLAEKKCFMITNETLGDLSQTSWKWGKICVYQTKQK